MLRDDKDSGQGAEWRKWEEVGGGVGSLMGRAPPGIPLQPRKMPEEMIIK